MALENPEQAKLLKCAGRGVRKVPGQMNKLERRYFDTLTMRKAQGEILDFWYEPVTFKLAFDTRYTPDFMIMFPTGLIAFHETKGFWEEDAKIKIKCAADKFPFIFTGVKWVSGGWSYENFSRNIVEPGLCKMEVGASA